MATCVVRHRALPRRLYELYDLNHLHLVNMAAFPPTPWGGDFTQGQYRQGQGGEGRLGGGGGVTTVLNLDMQKKIKPKKTLMCLHLPAGQYRQAGLHPATLFTHWYVERDYARELRVWREFVARLGSSQSRCYVVVHDDPSRGFNIDRALFPEVEKNCTEARRRSRFEILPPKT